MTNLISSQKNEKSISDLLVMARPERVVTGRSLLSSSSAAMNAKMTSFESSSPSESKEAAFQGADGCSERSAEFLKPEYQLKPSDGRRLNFVITMQQEAFEKLSGLLKKLKDHDSTLFQANGITLNYGEKFHHDFNVEHIASVEAKQLYYRFHGNWKPSKKRRRPLNRFSRAYKERVYQRKEN